MSTLHPLRQTVMDILDHLPDNATLEDVQYHLMVRQRIERSIQQADAGELIDHEEVEKRIDQWLSESDGPRSR